MQHPIQRLLYVPETGRLYTCTGPHIHSFNARTGELLAKWTAPTAVQQVKKKKKGKSGNIVGRKRKSGDEGGEEGEEEEEMKEAGEEGEGEVEGEGGKANDNSISKIISAQAGKYILTVTNEDKTVRVLDGGGLWELSSRYVYHRSTPPPTTIYILLSTSSIMANSQNRIEQCLKDPALSCSQTPTRQSLWLINSATYTPSHSSSFPKPSPPPPPPPCLPPPHSKIRNRNATARKSPTTYHSRTNFSWDTYLC